MTIVRRMGVDDVPAAVQALKNRVDATALTHTQLTELLHRAASSEGALAKIAISRDNVLLGLALAELPESAGARLEVLWVHDSARRRHLARALLTSMGPAWKGRRVVATIPAAADLRAVRALLRPYSFKATSREHVLVARPVNTQVGKSALVRSRS